MTDTPGPDDAKSPSIEPGSAMIEAVRARALEQIRQEQERPGPARSDRIQVLVFTICAVAILVIFLNFVVTGLHRIMDIWYPGSISHRGEPPAVTVDPKQPFMIGVIVEGESSASSASSASSSVSR